MTLDPDTLAPEEIIERLLERAGRRGLPEFEVFLLRKDSLAIAAKEGRLDQVRRQDELGAALRMLDRGRLGFAYTTIFTTEALDRTAARAAAAAALTDPQPGLELPDPPDGPWLPGEGPDPEVERTPLEEKIERVLEMERSALEFDPRIERVRLAEYRQTAYSVWLANSRGLGYKHSGTIFSADVLAKAAAGDEAEMGYESDFSLRYAGLDLSALGRAAARRAVMSLGGRRVPSGKTPVILENRVAAAFLGLLTPSFLAENVQKGKSTLAGKLGQTIMSPVINITDDGLYPGGLASSPADGEGAPRRKTPLVEGGRLTGLLYDLTRANREGQVSTGNANRGDYRMPPSLGPSNVILAPGMKSPQDLSQDLSEGLLVTEVMGLHTADAISGDFSLGAAGFKISRGRPEYPVKGLALAGNLFVMFNRVAGVGSDFRLTGATGAPALLIEELIVGGRRP
ncbi:MAG: TldD/PmbA family protein [Thermodesulfobacteriota bacterium]